MNSKERFLTALNNEEHDRPPFWFMRQAGRHLPEYRETRKGTTFEDVLFTPELASTVTIQPVKRYDTDAAIIFSDILLPFYACNRNLKIVPEKGPILDPIQAHNDIPSLFDNCEKHFERILNPLQTAIKTVRKALPEKAVIGFSGAPYTLSSYLIEGKSTKDSTLTKAFAFQNEKEYQALLKHITRLITQQLHAQIEAGVDAIQIFDSWAYHLSPEQYDNLVLPQTISLIKDIKKHIPVIYYSRGTKQLLHSISKIPANTISIDHTVSILEARATLPSQTGIQGNLDPAFLFVSPSKAKPHIKQVLEQGTTMNNYIFNLSQGIHKTTPPPHVQALATQIKNTKKE